MNSRVLVSPKSTSEPTDRKAEAALTTRVLDWLERERGARPAGIDEKAWEHAVHRAKGHYQKGLERYRRLFFELGWSGKQHGLDIGSGAGHWAIAFARDNGQAIGIDKNEGVVHLANGAAAELGLAGRVRHQFGQAEALDFPDRHFDAAWMHGVLMFCDIEDSISEVARVLEPGGHFYCGYSSTGLRLNAIYVAVSKLQRPSLKAQLANYMSATLQRDGMARSPWSGIGCATAEELAAVCRVFGLSLLGRPGLQDGRPDFAGIPGTIDLLCVRDGEPQAFRAQLLDVSAGNHAGRAHYRELLRLGLGKLVHDVLHERGETLDDPEIRSLYVLAGVRAGRTEAVAALAENGVDPLVRGLLAFDRGRIEDAVGAFRSLSADHPDRSFLLGAALLRAGESAAAAIEFEAGAEAKLRPVECEFGAMLARLGVADWSEQRKRMGRALRALPERPGASPEKIDQLVGSLVGREPAA